MNRATTDGIVKRTAKLLRQRKLFAIDTMRYVPGYLDKMRYLC